MKKRLLSLVLCLVMVFSLFPAFAAPAQAVTGDQVAKSKDYTYTWNSTTGKILHYDSDKKYNGKRVHGDAYGTISLTVTDGKFANYSVSINLERDKGSSTSVDTYVHNSISVKNEATRAVNVIKTALESIRGQWARYDTLVGALPEVYIKTGSYTDGDKGNSISAIDFYNRFYGTLRNKLVELFEAETEWKATITWKNGDTPLTTSSVSCGERPTYSGAAPTKQGATFMGWSEDRTASTGVTILPPATENKTYYAIFREDPEDVIWAYTPVISADNNAWKTSSDYGTQQLYAYIDMDNNGTYEYVPVDPVVGDLYTAIDRPTSGWTAANAASTKSSNNSREDKNLYYKDGNNYEAVITTYAPYYRLAGNATTPLSADNFSGGTFSGSLFYTANNSQLKNDYFFNSYGKDNLNSVEPFWHRVYENTTGVATLDRNGYYIDIWYYKNQETGDSIPEKQGPTKNQAFDTYESKYGTEVLRIPNCFTDDEHGPYEAYQSGLYFWSQQDYTGGELYTRRDNYSTTLNRMYAASGTVIAWPDTQETINSTTIPGSIARNDVTLYYHDSGVIKLVYKGTETTLNGCAVSDVYGAEIYPGTLFIREPAVMGDLYGEKSLSARQNDGSYNLTIDSWSDGTHQAFEDSAEPDPADLPAKTPLDIVLVLDQSGSMRVADLEGDGTVTPSIAKNGATTWSVDDLQDGTQYYYEKDGKYYPVHLGKGTLYTGPVSVRGNETFGWGNDGISVMVNGAPTYYNVRTSYYAYVDTDDDNIPEMHRIRAITAGLDLHYGFYPYIYKDENSQEAQMTKWTDNHYWFRIISPWGANKLRLNDKWKRIVADGNYDNAALISFIDKDGKLLGATDAACNSAKMNYSWVTDTAYMKNLYYASSRDYANLYYVDDNGNQQIIGTRFMSSEDITTKGPLYTLSGGTKRVEALESAVNEFVRIIKNDATETDREVDHQIAIVGYAQNHSAAISPAASDAKVLGSNGLTTYTNTGVFTNSFGTFINYDQSPDYAGAFVSAAEITKDFTNPETFGTWGGTYPSYGMDMAKQILQNGRSNAKKVVIVFTDGEPGEDGYQASTAAEALISGAEVKGMDGVEVYTVGLYPQSVSTEGASFLKHLSSEYATREVPINAADMNPDQTYLVKQGSQYVAVSTDYYGESSLGWWEDLGNGQYRLMNVKGSNAGAGEEYLYDGSTQLTGESAKINRTYTTENGKTARYEYHWFDAEMNFADPTGTVYTLSNDRQPGEYSMTTSTKTGLEQIFRDVAAEIKAINVPTGVQSSGTIPVDYNGTNSVIRDTISGDFSISNPTVKLELVPATLVNGEVVEKAGAVATDVTNNPAYRYSWDGKTITVTGYDFGENSIYEGHDGNIMRVTVMGLQPTVVGKAYSNVESQSGVYKFENGAVGDRLIPYNNPDTTVETYTVNWNVEGSDVESDKNVLFGAAPSYDGDAPTKAENDQYSYTFAGWSAVENDNPVNALPVDQLPAVPANADSQNVITYYAIFTPVEKEYYDVYWMNGSKEMEHDEDVLAGTYPTYDGATPTSDDPHSFFIGWTDNSGFTVDEKTTAADLEANLYYGNKTVDQMTQSDDKVVTLYAVFLVKDVTEKPVVVVEYSMKYELDKNVYGFDVESENNGTFDLELDGKDANNVATGTFYFTPGMGLKGGVADLTPLSKVSAAIYNTDAPIDSSATTFNRVVVVPGSSIYFDDSLAQYDENNNFTSATMVDGKYDYETALAGKDVDSTDDLDKGETRTFKFSGSRIDVYCTTDGIGNSVYVTLKDEQGNKAKDINNKDVGAVLVSNTFKSGTMYSTPTVSFDNLDNTKTYVLTLKAMTKDVTYRLDGVRVYNPTDNSLNGESGVKYTQVRDLLTAFDTSVGDGTSYASGAVFVDKDGFNPETPSDFATYQTYGPKNEVYLAPGEAIAFQVHDYDTVMIGLKSQTGKGVAYVTHLDKNARSVELTSVVERYVEVVPTTTGIVVVKNNTDPTKAPHELIAVTNVRVMPGDKAPAPAPAPSPVVPTPNEPGAVTDPTFSMNTNSVKSYLRSFNTLAVVEPEVVEEPDPSPSVNPEPTPSATPDPEPTADPDPVPTKTPSIVDILSQLFSDFVSRLFGGISRLFGN